MLILFMSLICFKTFITQKLCFFELRTTLDSTEKALSIGINGVSLTLIMATGRHFVFHFTVYAWTFKALKVLS